MPADIWILILILFFCLFGMAASFLPGIPGALLNYAALWILQYKYSSFESGFLIAWTIIVLLVIIVDYFMPVWFAKKYGYTKYRIWFSFFGILIGLIFIPWIGVFFAPVTMVLGMLVGALIGEIAGGKEKVLNTLTSGLAGFAGTMFSMLMKIIVSVVLSVYLFVTLTRVS